MFRSSVDSSLPGSGVECFVAFLFRHLFRMQIFHFFGWLWIMNFIIALGQCVLAGAFASWYFAYHKPDVSFRFVFYIYFFKSFLPALGYWRRFSSLRVGYNIGGSIRFSSVAVSKLSGNLYSVARQVSWHLMILLHPSNILFRTYQHLHSCMKTLLVLFVINVTLQKIETK